MMSGPRDDPCFDPSDSPASILRSAFEAESGRPRDTRPAFKGRPPPPLPGPRDGGLFGTTAGEHALHANVAFVTGVLEHHVR